MKIAIGLTCVMLLISCSNKDTVKKEDPKKDTTVETSSVEEGKSQEEVTEVIPLPSTYAELEARPQGEYYNIVIEKTEVLEAFKDLPDLSESASEEELDHYYNKLLEKMQQDYKGPEEIINRLRFQLIGNPEIEDSRYQFKENLNIVIILDASGSMAQKINGPTKMDAAKQAIISFVKKLPKEANVGIRIYGHKGSNADADKALSCSSTDLIYPISTYNQGSFQAALDTIQPVGWTPTGLALREAQNDLSAFNGENSMNIIYLVSDGVSTCEDQPIEAAKSLYSSNIEPIINVIGFDVDSKGKNELLELARATEGIYSDATNSEQLTSELSEISNIAEAWEEWREKGKQNLDYTHVSNKLDIFVYITDEETKRINEKVNIDLIMSVLKQNGHIPNEVYDYLLKKNESYHRWIKEEVEKFEIDLKALNEQGYVEALKALEEKYQTNTN